MTRPPVVLLHGWSVDARIWGRLEVALGERYDVRVPDLPGHRGTPLGLDGRPPSEYHAVAVDHLVAWWEEGGLGSAPIVAWAWGGQVLVDAMATGRVAPRSVALVAGAAPFQQARTHEAVLRDWPRLARRLVAAMTVVPLSEATQAWIASLMTSTSLVAVAAVQATPWVPPPGFALPAGSIAVLGAADALTPPGPNRALAEEWGATVHELPGVGHLPFIEAPEAFHAVLDPWLAATSPDHR